MRGFTCLHALREAGYRVPKDIAYVRVSNLLQIPELDANDVTSMLSVLYDTIYTTRVLYGIIIEINQENTTPPSQKTAPIAERRSGQSGRRSTIERVTSWQKKSGTGRTNLRKNCCGLPRRRGLHRCVSKQNLRYPRRRRDPAGKRSPAVSDLKSKGAAH